jgi:hypothetical protein
VLDVDDLPPARFEELGGVVLARSLLGAGASRAAVERVAVESGGNPLFLIELASWFSEAASAAEPRAAP